MSEGSECEACLLGVCRGRFVAPGAGGGALTVPRLHMNSERTSGRQSEAQHASSRFDLEVPNDRSDAAIAGLVEQVLVELRHEPVGAEYVSANVWEPTRTQYVRDETGAAPFTKRHYDERLGWVVGSITRAGVREELVTHLSRDRSQVSQRSDAQSPTSTDRFWVRPVEVLRSSRLGRGRR
jgi:hypothetical protein